MLMLFSILLPRRRRVRADISAKALLAADDACFLDKMRDRIDMDKLIDTFTSRVPSAQVPLPVSFRTDVMVIDLESVLRRISPTTSMPTAD
jgi:hypothetical protein